MSLVDAVRTAGIIPSAGATQASKKGYSEKLSSLLAHEVAGGLRAVGFMGVKPLPGGPGERPFQGGLGPKKVDVSYADERHGLLLAESVKTICFPPYGKNLKNRFGDLCTEAITLHMRFPYGVVCALFAMPEEADFDITPQRMMSTFQRTRILLATISGRTDYTSPAEKFEDVTTLLFRPRREGIDEPRVRLFSSVARPLRGPEISEEEFYRSLRDIYNVRNPHAMVGIAGLGEEDSE